MMAKELKKIIIRLSVSIPEWLIELYRRFKPLPPRIYFCYNQSIHHIYHSIFIAIELSNLQKKYEVAVLSTSREASRIIEGELSSISNNIRFVKIKHPGYNKIDFNINWFVFLCRIRMHLPVAIILTDYFDNVFRQLLVKTFWVYVFHGPESRGYTHPHVRDYDLVILPGQGELERIQARIGQLNNYEVIGYSKFDYFRYHKIIPPSLFEDSKPVIMYNPHFDETQSSFFDKGIELLRTLSETGRYNIIFMPHPDLVRKHPRLIDSTRLLSDVAVIDRPPINLNYMAVTDLYITDVSSAVFEWLYFNKPVVFFNTKKIDWNKTRPYPSWACGRVVEDIPGMLEAIEYSLKHPEEFRARREEVFNKTFLNQDKNVSKIIARTILDRLEKVKYRPQIFFFGNLSQRQGLNRLILPLAKQLSKQTELRLVCRDASRSDFPNLDKMIKRFNILPLKRILSFTPLRWNLKLTVLIEYTLFDYFASRLVKNSSPVYAFQGMALCIFKVATRLGLKKILIATSLHIERVWQIHKGEEKILGYDYEWLNLRLKNKMLKEYDLADLIIVPSQLTYQTFLEKGISEAKLKYLPQEVDRDYYRRREHKKDKIFRILYVGRFTPQKGIHYLIKAFKELNLPDSELLLFGGVATRKARNWLNRLIERGNNIKIKHGDPRPAYEQASVLVHPSLNDNTGATIFEALAYGLPVIVTENTGAKELIKEGENGFIIPIRDVEAIKDKIRYYYSMSKKE